MLTGRPLPPPLPPRASLEPLVVAIARTDLDDQAWDVVEHEAQIEGNTRLNVLAGGAAS